MSAYHPRQRPSPAARTAFTPPTRWEVPAARARYWPTLDRERATCDVEHDAVRRYAAITTAISSARPLGLGRRGLADLAGLPPSVVEAALAGRGWATLNTLGRLACVVGLRLVLAGDQAGIDLGNGVSPWRPPDRAAGETAALNAAGLAGDPNAITRLGQAGHHPPAICQQQAVALAPAWHNLIVADLWWRLGYQKMTAVTAADELGVRPNTIGAARRTVAPHGWVSTRLVMGLAYLLQCHLQVRPDIHPWPPAPWERS